jgi:hypothetical protein
MPIGVLNPADKDHSTATRPVAPVGGAAQRRWYSDPLNTEVRDHDFNGIIAQIRHVIDHFAIPDVEGDDTLLRQAIVKGTTALTGNLAALQAIIPGADKVPFWSSTSTASLTTFVATAFSRGLMAHANLATWQTALGITAAGKPNVIAFGNLVSAANTLGYFTGPGTMALTPFTPSARQLLDDATFPAMRATLGLVGPYLDFTTLSLLGAQPLVFNGGQVTSNTTGIPVVLMTIKSGAATTGYIGLSAAPGGFDSSRGAYIVAYGSTHATAAGDLVLRSGANAGAQIMLNGVAVGPLATSTNAANLTGTLPVNIIADHSLPYAKLAVIAHDRILGNVSGANASPVALTAAQVRDMLDLSGGGTGDGTGTLAPIATSGSAAHLTSGYIPAARYQAGTVPLAALHIIPIDTILGNTGTTPLAPVALTVAQVKAMLGLDTLGGQLAAIASSGSAADLIVGLIPVNRYGAATIPLNKLVVISTDHILGNVSGNNLSPYPLTPSQVKTMLGIATPGAGLATIAVTGSAADLVTGTIPQARYGTGTIPLSKMVVIPTDTIIGNVSGGNLTAYPLTVAQVRAMLNLGGSTGPLAAIATSGSAADLVTGIIPTSRYGSASIAYSKLALIPPDTILGNTLVNLGPPVALTVGEIKAMLGITGGPGLADIAASGSAADLIAGIIPAARYGTGTITWAKLAIMPVDTLLGNTASSPAAPVALTVADVKLMLGIASLGSNLAAIASSGSAADLITGTIPAARIAVGEIALNKLTVISAATILGNNGAAAASPKALTVSEVKAMLGVTAGTVMAAIATSGSAADLIAGSIPAARYANGTIALARLVVIPTHTIIGNDGATAAEPQALTVAEVKTMLGIATLGSNLAAIASSGSADDLVVGTIPAGRYAAGTIALSRLSVIAPNMLLGNAGAANASPAALTVAQVRTMLNLGGSSGTLSLIATSGSATDLIAGYIPGARFADHTILLAKLALIPPDTLVGNTLTVNAVPVPLTVTEVRAMLNLGGSTGTLAAIATSGSAADLITGYIPVTRIADHSLVLGKLAVQAANTILGNNTAGAIAPIALTVAQVRAMLDLSGGGGTATLAKIATSGSATDIITGTLNNQRLPDAGVMLNKLQAIATAHILGNVSGTSKSPYQLTAAEVKTMLGLDTAGSGLAKIATSGSATDLVTGTINNQRLPDAGVMLNKLAAITTAHILGNVSGTTKSPYQLTAAEVRIMLGIGGATGAPLAAIASSGSATDLITGYIPVARYADASIPFARMVKIAAARVIGNVGTATDYAQTVSMDQLHAAMALKQFARSTDLQYGTGTLANARLPLAGVTLDRLVPIAPNHVLGNVAAGNASPIQITAAQLSTMLGGLKAFATSTDMVHATGSLKLARLEPVLADRMIGNFTTATAPPVVVSKGQVIGWLDCMLNNPSVITAVNSIQTNWFLALSTAAGTGASPAYVIRRTMATPVLGNLGYISFQGNNAAKANVTFGEIMIYTTNLTSGAHASKMYLRTFNAGVATNVMTLGLGVQVGNPVGTDKGGGTLNAQVAVYDSGVALTCMAMQSEFLSGAIGVDLDKWDKIAVAGNGKQHEAAHHFAKLLKQGVDPRDPKKFITKMREMQALPGMPTESDWKHNELGVGEMVNRLWLAVEMFAVAWMSQIEKGETA